MNPLSPLMQTWNALSETEFKSARQLDIKVPFFERKYALLSELFKLGYIERRKQGKGYLYRRAPSLFLEGMNFEGPR